MNESKISQKLYAVILAYLSKYEEQLKRIFWFQFCRLRYAHCRLYYVSLIAVQSFEAVAPIEKTGKAIKV